MRGSGPSPPLIQPLQTPRSMGIGLSGAHTPSNIPRGEQHRHRHKYRFDALRCMCIESAGMLQRVFYPRRGHCVNTSIELSLTYKRAIQRFFLIIGRKSGCNPRFSTYNQLSFSRSTPWYSVARSLPSRLLLQRCQHSQRLPRASLQGEACRAL